MRFCRLSLRREGVVGIGCLVVSRFRRCITFCKECKLYSTWHYTVDCIEVQVKWSGILMDRSGQDNFWTFQMTGHVLHLVRAHLKVPGWSLVWNALLTKMLLMFLSHLNEVNEGWSFWSNLFFLEWWTLLSVVRVKCVGELSSIIIPLLKCL